MKYLQWKFRGRQSFPHGIPAASSVGIQYGPGKDDVLILKYDNRGKIYLQSGNGAPFRIHPHGSSNIEIITQTEGKWQGDDGIMVPSR